MAQHQLFSSFLRTIFHQVFIYAYGTVAIFIVAKSAVRPSVASSLATTTHWSPSWTIPNCFAYWMALTPRFVAGTLFNSSPTWIGCTPLCSINCLATLVLSQNARIGTFGLYADTNRGCKIPCVRLQLENKSQAMDQSSLTRTPFDVNTKIAFQFIPYPYIQESISFILSVRTRLVKLVDVYD